VIRKEAGFFFRTSSRVRLWWEFKKPKGPKGRYEREVQELDSSGDTPPCKVIPVILHGVVSPELDGERGELLALRQAWTWAAAVLASRPLMA